MKRLVVLGVAALTAFGFAAMGCSSDSKPAATTAGTGGAQNNGGAAATGGTTSTSTAATGGTTSTSTAATGGATSAGGASSVACGTTKSAFAETSSFATALGSWALNGTSTVATVAQTTTGPTSNATLCSAGCAAFTYNFPATAGSYGASAQFIEAYTAAQNLLGATITFTLAVDNPSAVPIQVQLFAGGGSVGGYGWSNITTITGTGLTTFDAATGFSTSTVVIANNSSATQQFCGSDTHSIGIQLQNTTALTAAGSVTVYLKQVVVTPAA